MFWLLLECHCGDSAPLKCYQTEWYFTMNVFLVSIKEMFHCHIDKCQSLFYSHGMLISGLKSHVKHFYTSPDFWRFYPVIGLIYIPTTDNMKKIRPVIYKKQKNKWKCGLNKCSVGLDICRMIQLKTVLAVPFCAVLAQFSGNESAMV